MRLLAPGNLVNKASQSFAVGGPPVPAGRDVVFTQDHETAFANNECDALH